MKSLHLDQRPALDIAREITRIHDNSLKAQEALRAELQRQADELTQECHSKLLEQWKLLFQELGLPEEEIGKWGLDARYLEAHGEAFLHKMGSCSCGMDHGDDGDDGDGNGNEAFAGLARLFGGHGKAH